jgi:hypothetical protein
MEFDSGVCFEDLLEEIPSLIKWRITST